MTRIVPRKVVVQFDNLSAAKEKMFFYSVSEEAKFFGCDQDVVQLIVCYTTVKKSVLMYLHSGQCDLGGRVRAYFLWVFDDTTEICNI